MNSTNDWLNEIKQKKAKLMLALGSSSLQHIRSGMDQERKRVLAEDQAAMKAMGGQMADAGDEDMVGDVDLGGNTYNISEPAKGQFGKLAGMALLAASLAAPTAALGWKYLDRPVIQPTDTDTNIGLRLFRDNIESPEPSE